LLNDKERYNIFLFFQINSILNVGESAYSQIQKLKGQDDPQELNYKANVKTKIDIKFKLLYIYLVESFLEMYLFPTEVKLKTKGVSIRRSSS